MAGRKCCKKKRCWPFGEVVLTRTEGCYICIHLHDLENSEADTLAISKRYLRIIYPFNPPSIQGARSCSNRRCGVVTCAMSSADLNLGLRILLAVPVLTSITSTKYLVGHIWALCTISIPTTVEGEKSYWCLAGNFREWFQSSLVIIIPATPSNPSIPYYHRISIELDDGKIYRKALYLMVKTMVSCRFSLKPIHSLLSTSKKYTQQVSVLGLARTSALLNLFSSSL